MIRMSYRWVVKAIIITMKVFQIFSVYASLALKEKIFEKSGNRPWSVLEIVT